MNLSLTPKLMVFPLHCCTSEGSFSVEWDGTEWNGAQWGAADWRKMDWRDEAQGGEVRREQCVPDNRLHSDSESREQYDLTTGPHFHSKPLVFLLLKAVVRMKWGRGNLENIEERAELPRNIKGCSSIPSNQGDDKASGCPPSQNVLTWRR